RRHTTFSRDWSSDVCSSDLFIDHPTASESVDRPERSLRDLAGRLVSDARYEGDGLYADIEVYPHWAPIIDAMAEHIGMSIRASRSEERRGGEEGRPGGARSA